MRGDRSKPAVVYMIINIETGDLYIGATTRCPAQRLREHCSESARCVHDGKLHAAIRQYGSGAFLVASIARCGTADEALLLEHDLVGKLKPAYNATAGGLGRIGWSPSDETRRKMSAAKKGRPGKRGWTHSEEAKRHLSVLGHASKDKFAQYSHLGPASMARAVTCLDDGQKFESASEAARHYGVARSALIELCQGKRFRKTVGGKRFAYVEAL